MKSDVFIDGLLYNNNPDLSWVSRHRFEQSDPKPPELINIGNSCYINSVLQVFFQIPELIITRNTQYLGYVYKQVLVDHRKVTTIKV